MIPALFNLTAWACLTPNIPVASPGAKIQSIELLLREFNLENPRKNAGSGGTSW